MLQYSLRCTKEIQSQICIDDDGKETEKVEKEEGNRSTPKFGFLDTKRGVNIE